MENQETQEKQPELSIADLKNLITLLDVASRRGAFGAAELSSVGAVFDRVNKFLTAVTPQQSAEEQPAEEQQTQ